MSAVWSTLITLVPAILVILAVTAFVFQMRGFEKRISKKLDALPRELEREKDKGRREEPPPPKGDLRGEIGSLKSLIGNIPHNTAQLIADSVLRSQERVPAAPPPRTPIAVRAYEPYEQYESYEKTSRPEDGVAILLQLANRIADKGSISLETARESTSTIGATVSSWSDAGEGGTAAFIVDYRGSFYVVPNIMKPARLRKEWFNRSDFGFNDEIQHIASLPRLRRRGDDFEVLEPGRFTQ